MSIEFHEETVGGVVKVRVSGKLTKDDYATFVPAVEKLIEEHGKIRILFEMHEFHGWDLEALWEDTKFDIKHFRDIERLALVGEKKWEELMGTFCQPFTSATIKYFPREKIDEAESWLRE